MIGHFCPACRRKHTIHGGFYQRLALIVAFVVAVWAWAHRHELHRFVCWR